MLAVVVVAALQGGGEAALGQTGGQGLSLVPRYTTIRVNNPEPADRAQMGWLGIANAGDLNGDGADDVLVPNYEGPGKIFIFSGATGQLLRTLELPDAATSTAGSAGNFVYPAKLTDLGSCPGTAANQPCPSIAAGDGVPEVLVGASGVDIPGAAPDMGRAYVFDGATGALLKKVQMPPADLAAEAAQFPTGKSFSFGRAVISPASEFPATASANVKRGDFDGGGKADFVVGNPTFYESGPASNPSCNPGPCPGSGRAYFFRGEDITGSANTILDAPLRVVKNPAAESDAEHERFGHAFVAVGDVGQCNTSPGAGVSCPAGTTVADGRPEVVVTAHRAESGGLDAGVVWLVDGATGAILRRYDHPEPQDNALFGYTVGTMSTAVGDIAGSPLPDIYAPAVGQVGVEVGQGRGYVLNGDWASSPSLLARLDDPTPHRGENFGTPVSGIGNVSGDARNEILVGVAGPWTPGDDRTYLGQVLVVEPATGAIKLTLEDPDQQPGSGFGQGAVQIGDVNRDGAMDFAALSGYWTGETDREGRLYIFHSINPPSQTPKGPPPVGLAAFEGCPATSANVIRASSANNRITGTVGGDRIFGGTGNDVVDALAGNDCVDLGTGDDRGQGGLGNDLLLAGDGADRVSGSSGKDKVNGNPGNDRLDGGRHDDNIAGDAGNDTLLGGFGNDRLHGVSGKDLITGSRGRDRINGGAGNDRVSGGSSGDRIAGDAGSDRINGNSGADSISGNSGNDRITSRDNSRDKVNCGGGRDTVVADRKDRVARNCERVKRS
ncbi:MAG TPA: hypothetical protein VGV10_03605 [Thermoleophilaceae bacterium]|nr:hypothetical protein [Thermoleophilaceae bacterium]